MYIHRAHSSAEKSIVCYLILNFPGLVNIYQEQRQYIEEDNKIICFLHIQSKYKAFKYRCFKKLYPYLCKRKVWILYIGSTILSSVCTVDIYISPERKFP